MSLLQPPESRLAIAAEMTAVYDELRRLARGYLRRNDGSLQPTALVHEVYLRMANWNGFHQRSRAEFFGAAACVMRTVLAAAGRKQMALRRGGDAIRVPLTGEIDDPHAMPLFDVVRLDIALSKLAQLNPDAARVVELCVFGGLTHAETADYLALSTATVKRRWVVARAWLFRELGCAP
jgi:RNA polymerase sigma factor (TIGR02999 family)